MYQLVHDREQIREFARNFLPTQRHEIIAVSLIARSKYLSEEKKDTFGDSQVLEQLICGGGDDDQPSKFCRQVLGLVRPFGSYVCVSPRGIEMDVPAEMLGVYAHLDHKHTLKVLQSTVSLILDRLLCLTGRPSGSMDELPNGWVEYTQQLMKSPRIPSSPNYRQIDLDSKDSDFINRVRQILSQAKVRLLMTIETHGGFHLIYEGKQPGINHSLLHQFQEETRVENSYVFKVMSHPRVVIPGTFHVGFPARISSIFPKE